MTLPPHLCSVQRGNLVAPLQWAVPECHHGQTHDNKCWMLPWICVWAVNFQTLTAGFIRTIYMHKFSSFACSSPCSSPCSSSLSTSPSSSSLRPPPGSFQISCLHFLSAKIIDKQQGRSPVPGEQWVRGLPSLLHPQTLPRNYFRGWRYNTVAEHSTVVEHLPGMWQCYYQHVVGDGEEEGTHSRQN